MAKYSRFDPRNKKKNRHKNQYLNQSTIKNVRKSTDNYSYDDTMDPHELDRILKTLR